MPVGVTSIPIVAQNRKRSPCRRRGRERGTGARTRIMALSRLPYEERVAPEGPDDGALATRIGNGDAEALGMLYDRYSRVVYSFALRMVADPGSAEELTQEVFIRVWRQGGQYQHSRGALLTWIL